MDTENQKLRQGMNLFLYFSAAIVQLTSFTCGLAFSWTSPISPKLETLQGNPLGYPLSSDELSWLASLLPLGTAIGPFAGGYLADSIGRKKTFIVAMVPSILSFVILAFGNSLYLYYLARVMVGICIGIIFTVIPMYIGETAEIHNRGTLGCLTGLFVALGILYGFCVGPYISIMYFSLSCIVGPILFLIFFTLLVPETPTYLIMAGKYEEAKISLGKFRKGNIENEFVEMTAAVKESLASSGGITDILKTKHLLKGQIIVMGLMTLQQLTAITAVIYYLQSIFDGAGLKLPAEISAIIIGFVQLVGTVGSTTAVERLGRRPLLLISHAITSVTLLILSLYYYLLTKIDMDSVAWVPIVSLIAYILFYNSGAGPLPITIIGEILPPHVKSSATAVTMAWCFVLSFVVAKFFPFLVDFVGIWFAFLVFGIGNAIGILFIWRYTPETKGKTLTEILEELK